MYWILTMFPVANGPDISFEIKFAVLSASSVWSLELSCDRFSVSDYLSIPAASYFLPLSLLISRLLIHLLCFRLTVSLLWFLWLPFFSICFSFPLPLVHLDLFAFSLLFSPPRFPSSLWCFSLPFLHSRSVPVLLSSPIICQIITFILSPSPFFSLHLSSGLLPHFSCVDLHSSPPLQSYLSIFVPL